MTTANAGRPGDHPVITVTRGRATRAEIAAIAAERGYVDAVIRPAETRPAVTRALRTILTNS